MPTSTPADPAELAAQVSAEVPPPVPERVSAPTATPARSWWLVTLGTLFSFRGRIGVVGFLLQWQLAALYFLIGGTIAVAGLMYIESTSYRYRGLPPEHQFAAIALVLVPSFWMLSAAYAKRLHDRSHSAWYILLCLVPACGLLTTLWLLLPGDGPNKYGAPPHLTAEPSNAATLLVLAGATLMTLLMTVLNEGFWSILRTI